MDLKWLGNSEGGRVSEGDARKAFGKEPITDDEIEAILTEKGWHYLDFFLCLSDAVGLAQAQWEVDDVRSRESI